MTIFRVPILLTFPGAGSPGANIWHIRTATLTGSGELSEANTLIGYIRTFYVAMNSYIPTGTTASLGTVTEVGTGREVVPTFAALAFGGTGSAPQMLAAVVTWRTSIAARRGRGRTFVGPLATTCMQNDGTPDSTFRNAVLTAAGALITSSSGFANGAIGVWGYDAAKPVGSPRNPADARVFRDYVGCTVRDLFGVLTSRRD